MGSRRRRRGRAPRWARWGDEQLLGLRFDELGIELAGSDVEPRVERLHDELERRGLRFRPHAWLSTEWFSPDGVPGIAIPFFLAHPRLRRLERDQFFEVEGGGEEECMRLLRHECGHAFDTAYNLRLRRGWREHFGRASEPYRQSYTPKPYSKSFVVNLDRCYAQSHPTEDFAETFAVWLRPRSDWRRRHRGWPALKKLEYVDALMAEVADRVPAVRSREQTESLSKLRRTLGEHYREKLERYGTDTPDVYDRDLRRLFPEPTEEDAGPGRPAASFLRRARPELRRVIARWTGQYRYTIDVVLQDMIDRCEELDLRVRRPEAEALADATVSITVQTMNHIHGGHHQVVR